MSLTFFVIRFLSQPKNVLVILTVFGIVFYFTSILTSSKSTILSGMVGKVRQVSHSINLKDIEPLPPTPENKRANAAIVILTRNSDKDGIVSSLTDFENRFNRKYHYPYVFLNDEEFNTEFKDAILRTVSSNASFGLIPNQHWSYPSWINQTHAKECRDDMAQNNIIYGGSESYRHMCRFNSGFFFLHPLLAQYDYYWRIEPDVHFWCDINFDPFVYMQENKKKYSFVISFKEFESTIPTLWKTTKEYISSRKLQPTWFNFFQNSEGGYNLCHFWSNFEIADLRFFRSKQYLDFFQFLDSKGGFFYERWGDAPVHSLAVGLFLKKSEVHFFNDIGYYHPPYTHCPSGGGFQDMCQCKEGFNFDQQPQSSCVPSWLNYQPEVDESQVPDFDVMSQGFEVSSV